MKENVKEELFESMPVPAAVAKLTVPAILNVVLAYMVRSEGASLHASIGTMSGCLLNILLDPIFILPWGLNMGAAGAGLATFLSNCAACCYFFVLLYHVLNWLFPLYGLAYAQPFAELILAAAVLVMLRRILTVHGAKGA